MTAGVQIHEVGGEAALTLVAGSAGLTLVPALGLLGCGLTVAGRSVVGPHRPLRDAVAGHTLGLPLLHPWANRLAGDDLEVLGRRVDLAGRPGVPRDPNGLPIHGLLVGRDGWIVTALRSSGDEVILVAGFDFAAHPDLLAAFPFPHRVEVTYRLRARGPSAAALTVTTAVEAGGDTAVPVSFGWHPYLDPGGDRRAWRLRLPARQRLVADDRLLPTGNLEPCPVEDGVLGDRAFDDGYRLGEDRVLRVEGADARIEMVPGDGYTVAQVYAPVDDRLIALEPMTAATNALGTGDHPIVAASERFEASFDLLVEVA